MSARDDFELVRQACNEQAKFGLPFPNHINGQQIKDAFNNLFTPRPLRDLVAEGYEEFWIKTELSGWQKSYVHEFGDAGDFIYMFEGHANVVKIEKYLDHLAIPILTPEDMGER